MIHTKYRIGWTLPWAHGLKHVILPPNKVKIINVVGESVPGLVVNDAEAEPFHQGTYFDGHLPTRAYEPLVSLYSI